MSKCKTVYNQAIEYLNSNQGFDKLGKAKGTKEQQFKTLSMRTWLKDNQYNVPAKLLHSTLQRAYKAWSMCKPEKDTKLKLAQWCKGNFTLETDPKALSKGKLYSKFWGKNKPLVFRDNHREVSLLQGTCLLIYIKYGRLYCSQPNLVKYKANNQKELVVALDPGIRNFITGFDGHSGYQFTNSKDLERLAKIQAYRAKLHKNLRGKSLKQKQKIKYKMSRLNKKIFNLTKDLHRKVAAWISNNYRIVFVPSYKVKKIYSKNRSNKTNRKNQLNWAWFRFRETLEYHCAKNGSVVVEVSEAYTSKTCSKCGHVHKKLGSNKVFWCPECGHKLDRDLNGAINIYLNSLVTQGGLG